MQGAPGQGCVFGEEYLVFIAEYLYIGGMFLGAPRGNVM